MADKTIGSLPQAQSVDDSSLFVCEQQGTAMKTTGAQWKGYAIQAVSQYVAPAQQAAQQAQQAAQQATQAVSQIGTAVEDTQANAQAAQEAKEAAEAAQGLAETAKTEAEAAASGVAEDAQAAEQAKEAAIAAQQAAETAGGNAETSATGAATSASQASQSASDASGSATAAAGSATTASQAASNAQSAQTLAETAKAGAEAARDAIVNMLVEAITLETGQPATVSKSLVDQVYKLTFGLPKGKTGATGATGPQGVSVESIQLTNGNHAPGTTDTYTITLSDGSAFQFTVYNGANGTGAGDFMADGSVPMTGPLNMGGQKVTNVGAPTDPTDAVRQSDLKAVSDEVDDIISGTTAITIPAATEAKRGGVIIGEGLSVTEDGTVSADDQFPAGGTQGQVLTQGTTGPEWQDAPSGLPDGGAPGQVLTQGKSGPEWTDAPDPLPTGGETGQVLTKTASGTAWDDVPSDLPAGGTDGQILTKTADGVAWEDAPDGLPSGGEEGQVLTKTASGAQWDDVPSDIPAGGTQGQVLTKGDGETVTWSDPASGLPSGGTPGQLLSKTESGAEWVDKPVMYVTVSGTTSDKSSTEIIQASINGYAVFAVVSRRGALYALPLATQNLAGQAVSFMIFIGDRIISCYIKGTTATVSEIVLDASRVTFAPGETGLTADNVQDAIEEVQGNIPTDYVPTSRTVNGQALSQNITLDAEDVGAMPPPTRLTVTLNSSSWSGNSQTITVNGVITDTSAQDIDISCADKASADAWAAGGVWCSNPTQANRLTFTCTTPPTANINLNIRLWEVG